MAEWISDEMTFLLGEQKASRETRSCWPFFKDSYNVFSHTHTAYTPGSSSSSCCPLCVSVLFCFFLYNGRWMAPFPPSLLLLLFFLGSRYIKVPYLLCNVYVYVYIVYSRSYSTWYILSKLRYYLPYLTFSPPPSRERMKNRYFILGIYI